MALKYKPTIWQDDVPDVQVGTDLDAAHFNNNERATVEAYALAALNSMYQRYANGEIAQAATVKVAAVLNPGLQEIALPYSALRNTTNYDVDVVKPMQPAAGEVEKISITTMQVNGFKVNYTGTMTNMPIMFKITGGML